MSIRKDCIPWWLPTVSWLRSRAGVGDSRPLRDFTDPNMGDSRSSLMRLLKRKVFEGGRDVDTTTSTPTVVQAYPFTREETVSSLLLSKRQNNSHFVFLGRGGEECRNQGRLAMRGFRDLNTTVRGLLSARTGVAFH